MCISLYFYHSTFLLLQGFDGDTCTVSEEVDSCPGQGAEQSARAVPDEVEKMIEKLNFEKIRDRNDDAVEVKANLEHVNRIIGINNQRLNEIRDLSLAKIIVEDRKAGVLLQLVNQ